MCEEFQIVKFYLIVKDIFVYYMENVIVTSFT